MNNQGTGCRFERKKFSKTRTTIHILMYNNNIQTKPKPNIQEMESNHVKKMPQDEHAREAVEGAPRAYEIHT